MCSCRQTGSTFDKLHVALMLSSPVTKATLPVRLTAMPELDLSGKANGVESKSMQHLRILRAGSTSEVQAVRKARRWAGGGSAAVVMQGATMHVLRLHAPQQALRRLPHPALRPWRCLHALAGPAQAFQAEAGTDSSTAQQQHIQEDGVPAVELPVPTNVKIKTAEFVKSSVKLSQCPPPTLPEFAVIGRSNVGKSSLINMLTGRKSLAMVSKTPGQLN